MLSTPAAVIAGLTYDALPFMACRSTSRSRTSTAPTSRPPPTSTRARAQQFLRVVLPLSAPGVYAGILLVAITNIGDYVSAAILGGPWTTMIGNVIQTQYVQNANYPIASALALILMVALAGRDVPLRAGLRHAHDPGVRVSGAAATRSGAPGILGRARRAGAAGAVRLHGYSWLVIAYTLVPIGVMILYGFNKAPSERLTFAWKGFTLDWYRQLFDIPDLTAALVHSLEIAALSTLIAVAIGVPAALALARYRFRGHAARRARRPLRHRRALGRRRRLALGLLRLSSGSRAASGRS